LTLPFLIEQAKPPLIQQQKRPLMPGQQPPTAGEIDWNSVFTPGAPDGYMNPVYSQSMVHPHDPIPAHVDPDRKYYPATTAGHPDGGLLYLASTTTLGGDGMRDPSHVPSVLPRPSSKETLAV
jgi:hypothetical protein